MSLPLIDRWIVASVDGRRFLGVPDVAEGVRVSSVVHDQGMLRLTPVFELFVLPSIDPSGGFRRASACATVDFVTGSAVLYVRPSVAYLCADMSEEDRRSYERFLAMGEENAAKGRAKRVGLEVVR